MLKAVNFGPNAILDKRKASRTILEWLSGCKTSLACSSNARDWLYFDRANADILGLNQSGRSRERTQLPAGEKVLHAVVRGV